MERSLNIKRRAFTRFIDKCRPSEPEQDIVLAAIEPLARDPNIGYRVLFILPPLYQIRIGRYKVNYEFDAEVVTVLYIGMIGTCP